MDHRWAPGQPTGGDLQECTSYHAHSGQFYYNQCTYKNCFVCSWKTEPLFSLRGLCSDTQIDHQYVLLPQQIYDGNIFFLGFGSTNIIFSQKIKSWLIVDDQATDLLKSENIMPKKILGSLQLGKFSNHLPIGTHFWNLTDKCDKIMALKLTHVGKINIEKLINL